MGMDDLPRLTTQNVIGIAVAISGNVLISLALNLQKLAHKRLDTLKNDDPDDNGRMRPLLPPRRELSTGSSLNEQDEDEDTVTEHLTPTQQHSPIPESQPLLVVHPRDYASQLDPEPQSRNTGLFTRIFPFRNRFGRKKRVIAFPVDITTEDSVLRELDPRTPDEDEDDQSNETAYLKSTLWWTGFFLMNIGELGNFISYAFAPASVVAPLGTFALIANCAFAPIMLGEHFRKLDILGVCIAIVGVVTVVLSSNASDARLNPRQLIEAITQTPFLIYSGSYIGGAIILAILSQGKLGRSYVFIDIGLCALFGGFTVLSTKALSTLITLKWYGIFAEWITYPLIITLLGTGIGQIRYLNRALMRFDSKTVIPIQFVFFTLSAIIGSAILYGDFKKAGFHELVTFLYGCAAIFAGVHILAHGANGQQGGSGSTPEYDEENEDGARLGTMKKKRSTLIISTQPGRDASSLRKKGNVAVVGISPAQQLLLVHTPTRESPSIPRDWEAGYQDGDRDIGSTPNSYGRNRTLHGFGHDGTWSGTGSPRSRTRATTSNTADRSRTPQNYGSPNAGNVGGS